MEPTLNISPDEKDRSPGSLDVDSQLVEDIASLIEADQRGMVLNILTDLHPADLARIIAHVGKEEARTVLRWLSVETAADVLAELEDDFRAELADSIPQERLTAIIDELDTDDAADVLADLPVEVAEQILPELEDHFDVKELLSYDEDSAGGLMATEFVSVRDNCNVAEASS